MATRTGSAVWEGTLERGQGNDETRRRAFEGPFSFSSRFENGKGTNPEELIGAGEAGCFLNGARGQPRKRQVIRRNESARRRQ